MIYFVICQYFIEYGIIARGGRFLSVLNPIRKSQETITKIILMLPVIKASNAIYYIMRVYHVWQIYLKTTLSHLFTNILK